MRRLWLLGLLLLLVAAPPVQAGGIPDRRFGVIESYHAPADATALGAGWTRVTFEWNQIQPNGPDEWVEYPVPDSVIAAEVAAGREVVGLIIASPGWALAQFGGKNVPSGLDLPVDDPNNLWAVFVRRLVARHPEIRHWIIWNEPDIWGTDFQSWGGDAESFARLLKVAYLAAHEANPDVIIHLPAVTHWWDANYGRELFIRRLLTALQADPEAAAHGYYFDAFTLHLYFNPDTLYDLPQLYYGILAEYGITDKPLWIVETNAPPSDDPAWPIPGNAPRFRITQEDQANFVLEGFAMALAGGAQRIGFYKMRDLESDRVNPEPFGLVRLDGSRRPAFTAWQTATRYLAGFRRAKLLRRDAAGVVQVARAGGWTTVVWARGPEPVEVDVPAHAAAARLVNWRGEVRTVAATGGSYHLTLPASPCTQPANPCLIGGETYLIVEGGVSSGFVPAASGASSTPAATPTPTPTPTSTPTPTPTPSPTPSPTPTRTPFPTPRPLPPTPTPPPSVEIPVRPFGQGGFPALLLVAVLLLLALAGRRR